jgi:hypothetical protein
MQDNLYMNMRLFIKKIDKINSIIESSDLSELSNSSISNNSSDYLSLVEDSPKSQNSAFSNEYDVICL